MQKELVLSRQIRIKVIDPRTYDLFWGKTTPPYFISLHEKQAGLTTLPVLFLNQDADIFIASCAIQDYSGKRASLIFVHEDLDDVFFTKKTFIHLWESVCFNVYMISGDMNASKIQLMFKD